MSERVQIEQEQVRPAETRSDNWFSRRPLATLGRVALWTSFVGTISGLGGTIALTITNGTPSRDIVTATLLFLSTTILIATRMRALQALAVLLELYSLEILFTEPFVVESLANPKGPNGGYGHFIGDVLILVNALLSFAATIGMLLQNYHRLDWRTPRWFASVSSVLAGAAIGALLIGGLAPAEPSSAALVFAPLQAPRLAAGGGVPTSMNMGMAGAPTSVTQLQAPTATTIDRFSLTARPAQIPLSSGAMMPAWTFNGTAPGPTLHVRQGDEVIVTLVNHLSFAITIHWHGIRIANAEDGVAGVTQDAVKPGQTYVYRFIVPDAGTYWYHSHQFSYEETVNGLYGMLIVDPVTPTIHADVDYSVALHAWNGPNNQAIYTMNSSDSVLKQTAQPGQWIRLRIVNTAETLSGNPQLVTLVGAPFEVVSLDGHDLHGPQWLDQTPLPIGAAQRYDLYFQMPAHGSVALVTANDSQHYVRTPALVVGQGNVPTPLPTPGKWFDLTAYGTTVSTVITPQSHFNATYDIVLGNQVGTSLGRMGMTYTLNGKVFPSTGMIMVKEGQLIKLHFVNQTTLYHPMHLHGHVFTVLARNGQPLTGSPVYQDTVLVPPHETYDVAFVANNPGIWMLHCHNFLHANWGMDMMVMYDVSTPYTIGTASGNFPD